MRDFLVRSWYQTSLNYLSIFLLPFSYLFRLIVALRRYAYQQGYLRQEKFSVPVIAVGNLTVGGAGKTPLVIGLVSLLKQAGYQPGVVSRGCGGKSTVARLVDHQSEVSEVGDEALLITQRTQVPMAVAKRRIDAVQLLIKQGCNIIVSDDGLQHYAMSRDIEMIVVDGERRFGNQQCLPAGPLREPLQRLKQVDFIVCNGGTPQSNEFSMQLQADENFIFVTDTKQQCHVQALKNETLHAVAGIAYPQRFFRQLRAAGFNIIEHPFPDHHLFTASDLVFGDDKKIIMTEKDAVKCTRFATFSAWYWPVTTKLSSELEESVLKRVQAIHISESKG